MAKKFNLAEFLPEGVSKSDPSQVVEIPLAKLIANSRNFYGVRDVESLADSIALNGQLEPLIVYPYGAAGLYRVISGHRRLAALQMNKAESALCRVVEKPESAAREDLMLMAANGQRVKTGAEIAAEAERMTKALIQLRKDGAELPGRLRDLVADALGTSSTSLARKKVIDKQLKVPGFRQAWKDGKMGESVAYELARILPEENQYKALDMLIDEGVDYAKADIKTVQRIKKRIEAGESTRQDLHAEAEKRGIPIRDDDFSPLLAALVREALPQWIVDDVLGIPTKARGVERLHNYGFTHASTGGCAVNYHCDPGGLTIDTPIKRRMKWAEVWELLALDAMQRQAVEAPAEDEKKPALAKLKKDAGGASPAPTREPEDNGLDEVYMAVSRVIAPDWMTGDPPGDGRYLCAARLGAFGQKEYTCERIGAAWWVFNAPAPATFEVLGWWPLPGGWKEVAK